MKIYKDYNLSVGSRKIFKIVIINSQEDLHKKINNLGLSHETY